MALIFVLGPAGVGKSKLSEALAKKLDYLFYEIDQWPDADGIDANGLRDEWDAFCELAAPDDLIDVLNRRAHAAGKNGVVLSFPSMLVLKDDHLRAVEGKARVVYLTGSADQCRGAFLARERESGRGLDAAHWERHNETIMEFLKTEEAQRHSVAAFDDRGARRKLDEVLAEMAAAVR